MKKLFVTLSLVVLGFSSIVNAQPEKKFFDPHVSIYVDLGGRSDPDAIGGEPGIDGFVCDSWRWQTLGGIR